jgi:putative colanic acid biosynthesis glycosyltransferase WcaI
MRILLLNLYYPPDTSATAKMAATVVGALSAHHDVTVLCGRPSYDPTERRPWRLWQTELAGRARIVRVGSTDYPRLAMKRRVMNYLSYIALAVPRALFLRCDVVLAMTDPPFEGIVGAIVALLKGKPYVYNIRDMYPDMAVGGAIVKPGLLARVWERLHRWALRRAMRVIVLGEDMRARIIAKGVDPAGIEIARDGTEILPLDAPHPALDSEVVRAIRGDSKFVFLHAGNIGFYGAWETLIEATRHLEKSNPDVSLVFVGDGAQRDRLVGLADGCKSIRFLPFFPANKIPSVMAAGDVHVITVKKGLEGVVVPSKLYGTLAAGRPILAVTDGASDVSVITQEKKCGYAASPQIPAHVFLAMRAMAAGGADTPGLKAMGEAARAVAPDYDRVKELQKFVKIIEGAVKA